MVTTSVIVLLIMLSTTSVLLIASSPSHQKSISVNPVQHSSVAQQQSFDPIHITGNSDFELYGATGLGTPSDPYRFENLSITSNISCIVVEGTTAHFSISNSRLESTGVLGAILFSNVENGKVEDCEIVKAANGITIIDSLYCTIENTSIYDTLNGIYLNRVSNSTIVSSSIFYNNRGILLEVTDHCQIRNNTIYGNWQYGIEIALFSHNNSVYGNSIGWNDLLNPDSHNAIDNGENNFFDDNASVGNYWSDFNESESYTIYGIANSIDSIAQLLEDDVSPIITPLYDTAIDVESVGRTLTWSVYDMFPKSYIILENGFITMREVWPGGDITIGLDYLRIGMHAITITVTDGAGNEASDEVLVSVVSFVLGGIGTELVMIASGLTVTIFVTTILLIKKWS